MANASSTSRATARGLCRAAQRWAACAALAASLCAQHPAPMGEPDPLDLLVRAGERALDVEDPVASWRAFQDALIASPVHEEARIGLGRAHLLLGRAQIALAYAEHALTTDAMSEPAMTLAVRARIRARLFDQATASAEEYVSRLDAPGALLLAAQASSLFRVQRNEEAAQAYRAVLQRDPMHSEAHLRLGSGLSAPREVAITDPLRTAVARMRSGELDAAISALATEIAREPGHPVAHRLLGEALLQQRALACMALRDEAFARLRSAQEIPPLVDVPIADFLPAYPGLSGERKTVVDRAMALFGSRLERMIAIGGRHDLLLELDRTTDAPSRSTLRGKRTFDGRVWDDVRGIGGLCAATGIEALDDAAQFGFDTLVHEIAHQVHYYALRQSDQARIRELYKKAREHGRCLDYYAATNEAEYFGQGVEAFASLGKRPGGETTHGHTRFELWRVDRELHDFVARIVDRDPLAGERRVELLKAAVEVALRCGRPEDAAVAASMLPEGQGRSEASRRAESALRAATAW